MDRNIIHDFPIERANPYTHIRIEVSYRLGGIPTEFGGIEPRGYYIEIKPVQKHTLNGVATGTTIWEKERMKMVLKKAKRFSQKEFDKIISIIDPAEYRLIDFFQESDISSLSTFIRENIK